MDTLNRNKTTGLLHHVIGIFQLESCHCQNGIELEVAKMTKRTDHLKQHGNKDNPQFFILKKNQFQNQLRIQEIDGWNGRRTGLPEIYTSLSTKNL